MLTFDFLEMGLGLNPPPHFVYDIFRKIFLMLCSINWPSLIVWLPLLLTILGNMCIVIISFSNLSRDNFGINVSFLIKLFFVWPKKNQIKNAVTLRTKRAVNVKWKHFKLFSKGFHLPEIVSNLKVRLYYSRFLFMGLTCNWKIPLWLNSSSQWAFNCFRKIFSSEMFERVLNTPLHFLYCHTKTKKP